MSYQLEGDEQERKLFVGGLNKVLTDEDQLKQYFETYGTIIDCSIMRHHDKQSRGFGFVLFDDVVTVDNIMTAKKEGTNFDLDGHHIEIKRALPKVPGRSGSGFGGRGGGSLYRKVFVGGLPSTITEDDLRKYFERYGRVYEIEVLRDRETNRLRGFGFITFDDEDSADKCVQRRTHEICQKICEVKRAKTRSNIEKDDGGRGPAPATQHNDSSGPLGMSEVNQLIQQAFMMGQQTFQPGMQAPTAASLMSGGAQAPNNVLLQALMGQQGAAPVAPVAPAPAPAPAAAAAPPGLAGLAQLLQGGGIDANALVSLLKGESGTPAAPPAAKSSNGGGYYSTSYPPVSSYDMYSKTSSTNYGPSKEEENKRSYRPY